ncbi:hypothetical protein HID58_093768 [Brassica napus]|uniref:Uncharacterized protein n=1 Tax=Brassica napus TaxID=3708 RepID=A0ABQ7XBI1_BRANA|nr:hypothetical protein HID58_093768 [Brassica napus]
MEGSLVLALLLHEASFPIIGTNYKTLDGTCVPGSCKDQSASTVLTPSGISWKKAMYTSENPQGVLQVPEIRSAHVTCQYEHLFYRAAASERNLMHFYFDNDGGVSSNYLKKSSTPRLCPIQPDSDIGEESAEEKGRSPMKSPKD